jgi:hypothetical protein
MVERSAPLGNDRLDRHHAGLLFARRGRVVTDWIDPDDAPDWTAEQIARAQLSKGGKVVRPSRGTLTKVFYPDPEGKMHSMVIPGWVRDKKIEAGANFMWNAETGEPAGYSKRKGKGKGGKKC